MNEAQVLAKLAALVEEVTGIPAADVTWDKKFREELHVDSLSMVEIAVTMTDEFDIDLPDDELAELTTVGDAVKYVMAHPAPAA